MDTGIQIQAWNVLKYVALTLLLAPVAEKAMSQITAWRNAYLINHGKAIRLKSSVIGNIALHQEVETMHVSSYLWQLFSILLALVIALPFEYSSGAQSKLIWSQQPSHSSAIAINGSNDLILLALDNPSQQVECVDPDRLADVGEFVFLQPSKEKPPLLDGIVTLENVNQLLAVKYQGKSWQRRSIQSRAGDKGLQLFAGGRNGQQAIIGNPERRGLLAADFDSGFLCIGLLDDTFSCYELVGQFTISQLVYSLAAVRGASLFLRTRFEKDAKIFRFKGNLVTNSIGDPSVEENLFEQRLNESGFDWLVRLRDEGGSPSLSISTLRLDNQLRSTSCQYLGSVQIRPLRFQVGESVKGERFLVNVSAKGDLKVVKAGDRLQTILLTQVSEDWKCAIDMFYGVCVSDANGTLYFVTNAESVYEYEARFELRVTQKVEGDADLVILLSQIANEEKRSGSLAPWDLRNLLSFSHTQVEGARTITRRMDTSVPISSGLRVTGTLEIWALVLYGCLFSLFVSVLVCFKVKRLAGIDIEQMYRRVVLQKESGFHSSEKPSAAPTIGIEPDLENGVGGLTASYSTISENLLESQHGQSRKDGDQDGMGVFS